MSTGFDTQKADLFSEDMNVDDTGRMHLRGLASWAMIIVVTSVLGYVLSIIDVFRPQEVHAPVEGFYTAPRAEGNLGGTLIVVIIGLLVNFFLYRFAIRSRAAIAGNDGITLNSGIRNLKFYFVITSILMILSLLLVLLAMTSLIR